MIAADLMNPRTKTIRATDSMFAALQALQRAGAGEIPVVDSWGNLVGSLGDRDLCPLMNMLADADPGTASTALQRMVIDFMTTDVVSVNAQAAFDDVLAAMMAEGVSAISVVDDEGVLTGVVSYSDVAHAIEVGFVGAPPAAAA